LFLRSLDEQQDETRKSGYCELEAKLPGRVRLSWKLSQLAVTRQYSDCQTYYIVEQ